ncbi:MAG TPA: class I SAM-dependent methyltransferase [Candidatus Didemnitutus sp.]|nr:class I SAM-dependent methyltransferase [Candidatus Didemnitutus sp.]
MSERDPISGETVKADFNAIEAVIHYSRAAHELGLWASESLLLSRHLPDHDQPILEAGCGAGRVAIALHRLGYRTLTAFDFAPEMVDQARSLSTERGAEGIRFLEADAVTLAGNSTLPDDTFGGALFLFNGWGQIPGRANRRDALSGLHRKCRPGAILIFTTHDRDADPVERAHWQREAGHWKRGEQDPRLREFGDRYFVHEHGRTFMHLPDRAEVREDLAATRWTPVFDAMRDELARESRAVKEFSDNCRFWVAKKS